MRRYIHGRDQQSQYEVSARVWEATAKDAEVPQAVHSSLLGNPHNFLLALQSLGQDLLTTCSFELQPSCVPLQSDFDVVLVKLFSSTYVAP